MEQRAIKHMKGLNRELWFKRIIWIVSSIGFFISLGGCHSGPDALVIEPHVMSNIGDCPLWEVSNVQEVDSTSEDRIYRLDFTADLVLKKAPEVTAEEYRYLGWKVAYQSCHPYTALMSIENNGHFAVRYTVVGYGIFVKSKRHWRLLRGIAVTSLIPQ